MTPPKNLIGFNWIPGFCECWSADCYYHRSIGKCGLKWRRPVCFLSGFPMIDKVLVSFRSCPTTVANGPPCFTDVFKPGLQRPITCFVLIVSQSCIIYSCCGYRFQELLNKLDEISLPSWHHSGWCYQGFFLVWILFVGYLFKKLANTLTTVPTARKAWKECQDRISAFC